METKAEYAVPSEKSKDVQQSKFTPEFIDKLRHDLKTRNSMTIIYICTEFMNPALDEIERLNLEVIALRAALAESQKVTL